MSRLAVLLVAAILLAGCGGDGGDPTSTPAELTGTVRAVSRDAGRVTRFSVRSDGRTYVLHTPADVDYGFDLIHLEEHRTTGAPVKCRVEQRGGRLVATSILDA